MNPTREQLQELTAANMAVLAAHEAAKAAEAAKADSVKAYYKAYYKAYPGEANERIKP